MKEKKRLKSIHLIMLIITFFAFVSSKENLEDLVVLGIEPNSGPVSGETRVMARLKVLDTKKVSQFPYPKCRFGSKETQVDATYVKCTPNPRKMNEPEAEFEDRTEVNFFYFILFNSP